MKSFNKNLVKLGALSAIISTGAMHAAIDTTAVTSQLTTDGTAAITAIGLAMVGLAVVAVLFKWIKAAIFG